LRCGFKRVRHTQKKATEESSLSDTLCVVEAKAMTVREIAIDLIFERNAEGHYQVKSADVPGFYMAGDDIEAIHGDLNEVVSDLLRLNSGFIVSDIRWVPSIDDVKKHLEKPPLEGKIRYIASGTLAA
jgi:hypothetical protein